MIEISSPSRCKIHKTAFTPFTASNPYENAPGTCPGLSQDKAFLVEHFLSGLATQSNMKGHQLGNSITGLESNMAYYSIQVAVEGKNVRGQICFAQYMKDKNS